MCISRQGSNVILLFSLGALSSCWKANYFVAPVATPVFSAPWQGSLQTNYTTDGKLFFEAAGSFPSNLAVVASREFWGHSLSNDQEMASIAFGKFWPNQNIMYLWMAGFGFGSQRLDDSRSRTFQNHNLIQSLTGSSDFRKYFIQFEFASSETSHLSFYGPSGPDVKTSLGFASRLEYHDRYRFNQTLKEWDDSPITFNQDTTTTVDNLPKHTLGLDLVFFATTGISFVQLYGQIILSLPFRGYSDFWDLTEGVAGLRLSF